MYLALQHLKQFGKKQWANIRRIVQFWVVLPLCVNKTKINVFYKFFQTELFREGAFRVKKISKKKLLLVYCTGLLHVFLIYKALVCSI